MNAQTLTIAGVALLVLLLARKASAAPDASDPGSWNYIKGYTPGSGYYA